MDVSYQLYSSRNFGPVAQTLSMLSELGYSQVEGFGGLYASDDTVDALHAGLSETGLSMPSSHMAMELVRDAPDRALAIARTLGIKTIFVPAISERDKDAAGWAAFGQELAAAGRPFWDAGLTFGWHNHAFEFAEISGPDAPLDLILAGSDQLAVELDLAWIQVAGENPADWIAKYADRVAAAHLKDLAPVGTHVDEDGWADLGEGIMDWPGLMAQLRAAQTPLFVLEHDNPSDDRRFAERSIAAARAL